MTPRVKNPFKTAPDGIKAMMALEASIKASGLEHGLLELVKLRASQLNGCAFCIHMHATDARARGKSEMRLYMLNAWRESPLYSDRERAALAWTEALTLLAATGAPDADYDLLKSEFTESDPSGYRCQACAKRNRHAHRQSGGKQETENAGKDISDRVDNAVAAVAKGDGRHAVVVDDEVGVFEDLPGHRERRCQRQPHWRRPG